MEQLFKTRKMRLDLFKSRRSSDQKQPIDVPENLFRSCSECKESIPFEDLMHNLYVCPHCGAHLNYALDPQMRCV